MDEQYDIMLLQEVPWNPWWIQTKDSDPSPLKPITVYNKRYKIFHAPLTVSFKIRTAIYVRKELLKYGTFILTSFSEWHTTVLWQTVTQSVHISSVYSNINKREDMVPVVEQVMGTNRPQIMARDINLRHPSWDSGAGLDPHFYMADKVAKRLEQKRFKVLNPMKPTWGFGNVNKECTIDIFSVLHHLLSEFSPPIDISYSSLSDHAILHSQWHINHKIPLTENKNKKYENKQKRFS
jgi:hypothetical protein